MKKELRPEVIKTLKAIVVIVLLIALGVFIFVANKRVTNLEKRINTVDMRVTNLEITPTETATSSATATPTVAPTKVFLKAPVKAVPTVKK